MIDNKLVGRKIAAMRLENGLTQQQLAAMMNVSHQAVSKWESGQALPDIQTMLSLTRFFGITVEQLVAGEKSDAANAYADGVESDNNPEPGENENMKKEVGKMSIQQLLQMAPYMSRETVQEIVMEIEEPLTALQIARIAPYIPADCVEKLIEKHHPELNWDVLKRIAPYMRREAVDELARAIASGRETVKPANDNINKTINDIGKAFDDIGRGVGKAVKKAIRFGETVIDGVSSAINDLSEDVEIKQSAPARSGRAAELRRKAFERALDDGKWEWLEAHIAEIETDADFKAKAAKKAGEAGMQDWVLRNLGGYADSVTVEAAVSEGNWEWLGKNAWEMEASLQEKVALAAADAEKWEWLEKYSDRMTLDGCIMEVAKKALENGKQALASQLAENHMLPKQQADFVEYAYDAGNLEGVDGLFCLVSSEFEEKLVLKMALKGDWELIEKHVLALNEDTIASLMEAAVEQGNFDAIDMLDDYL